MIVALAASLAIVAADHTALRSAPRIGAAELETLWQGQVLEVRGEHAGYLKVYDYHGERGGYLRKESIRSIDTSEAGAPELLAVLRFLRDSPGSEALGISYGAAYLKAVRATALTAEPLDAMAQMAERLADEATLGAKHLANVAPHVEVAQQFGVRLHSFERNGRMKVCYDGDLFRRVLLLPGASAEQRARAALGLTRPDCIDPDLGPTLRTSLNAEGSKLLGEINDRELSAATLSRIHARRAGIYALIAFDQARHNESPTAAAEHALAELLAVHANDLEEDHKSDYVDAVLRVGAIRWATLPPAPQEGPLILSAAPGEPGQTCISLLDLRRHGSAPLLKRCTFGIVWMASLQAIPQVQALMLAVQPLESWRELWLIHEKAGVWSIDVLSPGADDPEEGYIEFAGFVPGTKRILTAREVKDHGRFQRRFEELRLNDLALVQQANSPDALRDFGRWQNVAWRRDTLTLH